MADDSKTLDILIRTKAELGGAQQFEASLESQIGKAKALGNVDEVKKLTGQLEQVRKSIASAAVEQNSLTAEVKNGAEAAEHSGVSHKELNLLFRTMGRETIPEFGHALHAAMFGPIGLAVGLTAAIHGVSEASALAAEKENAFKEAMATGADVETVTKSAGDYADALVKSAVAADDYARALAKIKNAENDIKAETDGNISRLHQEAAAWQAVQKSQTDAARADILAQSALGKISKEEEIRKLAELEDKAAADRDRKNKQTRDRELQERKQELIKTAAAAAAAAAVVPGAQDAAERASEGPERRAKLIESLKAQIKAAEERDKKITDEIGPIGFSDNSKTDFTSKLPGATSDEAVRYKIGKSQIESDKELIEKYKEILKKIDNSTAKVEYERKAAGAAAKLKSLQEKSLELAARVTELEKIITEKTRENQLADITDAAVANNEQQARSTQADTAIHNQAADQARKDIGVINDFQKQDTVNPDVLNKAAKALVDLKKTMGAHTELFENLADLGTSVAQIAAAQKKLAAETALARQLAQRALNNTNNP